MCKIVVTQNQKITTGVLIGVAIITLVPLGIWWYNNETSGRYMSAPRANHLLENTIFTAQPRVFATITQAEQPALLRSSFAVRVTDTGIENFHIFLSSFGYSLEKGQALHVVNANDTDIGFVLGVVIFYDFNVHYQEDMIFGMNAYDVNFDYFTQNGIDVIKI